MNIDHLKDLEDGQVKLSYIIDISDIHFVELG